MNILPYLIINNVNSQTIQGLIISELAPISKPQQRTRIEEIDGRDGDLVTPLGFAAYDKTVKIGLSYGYDIDEIIEFFNASGVVTFSNEPDKYYRFAIYQQIDFEKLIRFKTADVVFHCQPFKFSTTEEPLLFDVSSGSPITVTNEGNTDSRPNMLVLGNDNIDVSLNGSQILSIDLGDEERAVIIDSEDMNAYGAQSAIKEVISEINPVQDLHGQEYPYPAGAGKNKANLIERAQSTNQGVTSEVQANNKVIISGTSTGNGDATITFANNITFEDGKTYTLSFDGVDTRNGILAVIFHEYGGSYVTALYMNSSDHSLTFTKVGVFDRALLRTPSGITVNINANLQIEEGSTATPYAPYENICPITGFTESNVRLYGADICGGDYLADLIVATFPNAVKDEVNKTVSYTAASANSRKLFDKFKPNTVYTFFVDTASANTNIAVQYTDGTSMRLYAGVNVTSSSKSVAYLRGQNQSQSTVLNYEKCGVMEGALTASDFVPYLGSEYTIVFVDDQGDPIASYGGRINYTTGVLTLSKGFNKLSDFNWNINATYNVFYAFLANKAIGYDNIISDIYKTVRKSFQTMSNGEISGTNVNNGINIKDDAYNNVTDFINARGNSTICYELATPIEVQLTPTQINNLLGLNQLCTDTNGDITVTFSSDGVIRTETGDIVAFNCGAEDMTKGILLNRLITGDYDKIRLSKGDNTIVLSGGAQQFVIDKYSRWL